MDAADAPGVEPGSPNGHASPPTEPVPSLVAAVLQLTMAIDEQNQLLGQIVAQNADLIAAVIDDDDEGDEPTHDLAGRPIPR